MDRFDKRKRWRVMFGIEDGREIWWGLEVGVLWVTTEDLKWYNKEGVSKEGVWKSKGIKWSFQ